MASLTHYLCQTKSAKTLWVLVVCLGFVGAGILIGKSYKEWQDNPIATSITTHPIDDLDFPKVTICPPKNSNTALFHDLVKAGNATLSDERKITLRKAAYNIFIEQTHYEYVKNMLATSHMGNMDQVLKGFHSLPTPFNHANGLKVKMWNLNGTITTPMFRGDYNEDYYKDNREFLFVLQLPGDIKYQVGSGSLNIDLEFHTRKVKGWAEQVTIYTFHTTKQSWPDAEADCQTEGGHLASVTSEEVNQVVREMAGGNVTWLGGRKELGEWTWSDNETWGYESWNESSNGHCAQSTKGKWHATSCKNIYQFICQQTKVSNGDKRITLTYTKDDLSFSAFHAWYKYKAVSQHFLDSQKDKLMTGLRLTWRIENPTMTWTTNISEFGRSIHSPQRGGILSDRRFKAILTPPKEISNQMINASLVIELDIEKRPQDEVYALTTSFKLHRRWKSPALAETFCKNEGG